MDEHDSLAGLIRGRSSPTDAPANDKEHDGDASRKVGDIARRPGWSRPSRNIHVEPFAGNRTEAEHDESDGGAGRQDPPREHPCRQIVQEESASDERRQHGGRPRHDARKRPVRVVVKEIPVHRIPEAPELGKRPRAERLDEEVEPRLSPASLSKPEPQVLAKGQPVGYFNRPSRARPPATRSLAR